MAEMPGMIRPDLQALPQVRDRMTFLYLELAQACGQMLDGTFPRTRGGDPCHLKHSFTPNCFSPHTRGVIQKRNGWNGQNIFSDILRILFFLRKAKAATLFIQSN